MIKKETRFLEMLLQAVILLALEYEDQASSLPEFVCLPDEVVLTFVEAYRLFDQVIDAKLVTEAQITAIKTIDRFIPGKKDSNEHNSS